MRVIRQRLLYLMAEVSDTWTFSITDRYGHPMSPGTSITVECGDAKVEGNANVTLGDYLSGGSGITDFTIVLSDSDPIDGKPPKPALLVVTVNHPVYGVRYLDNCIRNY